MYRNYFVWKGRTYYTGDVFETYGDKKVVFVGYNMNDDTYSFSDLGLNARHSIAKNRLDWWLLKNTGEHNYRVHCPVKTKKNEFDIPGMLIGWIWYIVIMFISCIFKDCIMFWALWSLLFFSWRYNKIKEEGTYYEWKA